MLNCFKYLFISISLISSIICADATNAFVGQSPVQDCSQEYDSNNGYPCWDLINMLVNHPELGDVFATTALYKKCAAQSDALYQVGFDPGTDYFLPITQSLVRDGHTDDPDSLYSSLMWAKEQSKIYHISDAQQHALCSYRFQWKEDAFLSLKKALRLVSYVQLLAHNITCDETTSSEKQQVIKRVQNFDFKRLENNILTSLNRIEQHMKHN